VRGLIGAVFVDAGEKEWSFADETGFPPLPLRIRGVSLLPKEGTGAEEVKVQVTLSPELLLKEGDAVKFSGLGKVWLESKSGRVISSTPDAGSAENGAHNTVVVVVPMSGGKEPPLEQTIVLGEDSVVTKQAPIASLQHVHHLALSLSLSILLCYTLLCSDKLPNLNVSRFPFRL